MTISREWHDLLLRKRFGFGHDVNSTTNKGGLALFRPACPQPGINLPENRSDDPQLVGNLSIHSSTYILYRWLYRRNIVVDGNFSLEHMKMKQPSQDVFLNDGCGYVVESVPYKQHPQDSTESTQVSLSYVFTLHVSQYFSNISDHLVPITKPSIRQMQIAGI
jgi:hypothetical protein